MDGKHRQDITLRPKHPERDPAGLLRELKSAVDALLPIGTEAGAKWVQGKGEAEIAKAIKIKAEAISLIGQLENENLRLRNERDLARDQANNQAQQQLFQHEQHMVELETQRLKEIVDCILRLREAGANVDLNVIAALLVQAATSINERRGGNLMAPPQGS